MKMAAIAVACLMMAGCVARDMYTVNKEILVSTVWCGDRFVPAGAAVPADEWRGSRFLYVFGTNGVLSVYPESSGIAEGGDAVAMLRYIYTPEDDRLVIDSYGVFTVKELSVDRLRLEGDSGVLDLSFYAGAEPAPVPSSLN